MLRAALEAKINGKTKPLGALGRLEEIALQVGLIQNTSSPALRNPTIVVFAGDHGIAEAGVSAYPQVVTLQMVRNFLAGGAAINVLCAESDLALVVVDSGINGEVPAHPSLVSAKIGYGTKNFLREDAMSQQECRDALDAGARVIDDLHRRGTNLVGLGEMGIADSSSAAVLMSLLCGIPLEECVGSGTGLGHEAVAEKLRLLRMAVARHPGPLSPLRTLAAFGGFEIAMLCGAYLRAAERRMVILVDGFISTAALLVAEAIHPDVLDCCIFTHVSSELGHRRLLDHLRAEPLLSLRMRLGEGTGAALAYPIVKSSVAVLNRMASFADAGVSGRDA